MWWASPAGLPGVHPRAPPLPRQVSPGTGLPGPAWPALLILRELLVELMVPPLPSVSRRPAPPEILSAGPPHQLAVLSVSSPARSRPGGTSVWAGLQAWAARARLQQGWTGVSAALSGLFPPSEGRWQELGWPESGLRLEEAQAFSLGAAAVSHLLPVLQLQRLLPSRHLHDVGVGGRGGGRPEIKTPSPDCVSRSPVPAAAASPGGGPAGGGPARSGLSMPSVPCPPPRAQQMVGGGRQRRDQARGGGGAPLGTGAIALTAPGL